MFIYVYIKAVSSDCTENSLLTSWYILGFVPLCASLLNVLYFEYACVSLYVCIVNISVILEKTIRIPRSLSVKAASVLKGFLNKVSHFITHN